MRVTRALARVIQSINGQNLILMPRSARRSSGLRPQPIRQRRNTVAVEVARRSPRLRPQSIRQRRKTVAIQVDTWNPEFVQQCPELTAVQGDLPNPKPVQQRRKSVAVAVQVDMPYSERVQVVSPENPEIWCICRDEEHGKMILCENPFCVIKWFHMACLGMKTTPEGDWYCANCQLMNAHGISRQS
ncbi:inhibitor of growth protein 1-like [Sitodiplosis mosellana]|uniref:inhibitor of growth protein 1-like n=1 Tax=Sitodiplosis mosellana TaxID=263140 RepID=UPI0024437983|nr:inhibitor of growth protein 1-like [Sitodiplosis mosellana]